jgi:hypothetical protein
MPSRDVSLRMQHAPGERFGDRAYRSERYYAEVLQLHDESRPTQFHLLPNVYLMLALTYSGS